MKLFQFVVDNLPGLLFLWRVVNAWNGVPTNNQMMVDVSTFLGYKCTKASLADLLFVEKSNLGEHSPPPPVLSIREPWVVRLQFISSHKYSLEIVQLPNRSWVPNFLLGDLSYRASNKQTSNTAELNPDTFQKLQRQKQQQYQHKPRRSVAAAAVYI